MSKEFAAGFYKSQAWKRCRESYLKSVGYKCEDCLAKGIETPAVIVHHIEELTPLNIHTPEITLGFDNLKAVCRKCHADEHMHLTTSRCYFFGENGEIILKKSKKYTPQV
jgi:hypothetical protein